MICDNLGIATDGNLTFAGRDAVELAKKYGTPLYLMDEEKIRYNCRTYVDAMKKYFGENALPLYASKANSFKQIYRIVNEEGMGVDVVSAGEICTAVSAGFPMEKVYFHGNNKTDADIEYAIKNGVGYFVADNIDEINAIDEISGMHNVCSKILIRITPGIDPHTYDAVATGKVDSKFGSAIETGAAMEITRLAISKKNISLYGFHCHVGSQVFDSDVFFKSSDVMLGFIAETERILGFKTKELNLGGGYGVRYVETDPVIDIADNIAQVARVVKEKCDTLGIDVPAIRMEPGRSIVADSGLTLYTVGMVKQIPEYRNYVSVDGGMTDNPRYALYNSLYTVFLANKMQEECDFLCSVVGRCCECGDIIQESVKLPSSVKRGDIAAVLTTGAYNYSMASNYNRVPRPPIVMLTEDDEYVAVRRETLEDIIANDL
ncbi:MAG: diaminopimelate decarboxylase [Ruminococcaceae bacterium]|nr:diaminopimelate decarboxylase [Oscillospiraceae bacterium]